MAPLLVEMNHAQQIKVYQEINEVPETVPEKVKQLEAWIAKQPHLPNLTDYTRLVSFLRGCKYDMEKTRRKLDAYFSMRSGAPELFLNRDPLSAELSRVWDEVVLVPLRNLTPAGERVVWMQYPPEGISIKSSAALMKLSIMIGDLRLGLEEVGVNGDIYVLDAKHGTMEQYAKFTPAFIKKLLMVLKAAYPVRLRAVHVINANSVVEYVLNVSKPLLNEKIRDRIFFHRKDMTEFYKRIPKECMPQEFGGKNGSLKETSAAWRKTMESRRQWFLDQEGVQSDESKRPGGSVNFDEFFGVQKNFKKLSID